MFFLREGLSGLYPCQHIGRPTRQRQTIAGQSHQIIARTGGLSPETIPDTVQHSDTFHPISSKVKAYNINVYPQTEVIDLEQKRSKILLTIRDLTSESIFSCVADRVLLATGHWVEAKRRRNYFPSPWPAQYLLQNIPEGEKIAVLGTSLSAIEVVLTLTSNGRFSRNKANKLEYIPPSNPRYLALYSRRGLFPKVRGKMGKYRNRYLTREKVEHLSAVNKGMLTLASVFQQLNRQGLKVTNPTQTTYQTYKTGSIWIDPETLQLMRLSSDNITSKSDAVYAVGAMTRGQIIDTSTANGIVQSTSRIANNLVNELKKYLI